MVLHAGRALPAELAVLAHELGPFEHGAWLNAPTKASGIVDLALVPSGRTYHSIRRPFPLFVAAALDRINQRAGADRDCPYLLIWRTDRESFRIIEVQEADGRRPSKKRLPFLEAARSLGIQTSIVQWKLADAG